MPVFTGHSEAVHVELRDPLSPDQARQAFAAMPGVVVVDEPAASRYPLATDAAGKDEVFVGRVRQDVSVPDGRGLAFWVVSDNLRKGAAHERRPDRRAGRRPRLARAASRRAGRAA